MESVYDMVIVGGGPAGYTAALYAARAGLSTVVLEQLSAGGQMALTTQIDNYPGFAEGIDGYELAQRMRAGAERFGALTRLVRVREINLRENPRRIQTDEGSWLARTVVLATGAVPRTLGLPGEEALTGRGVHYCALCDGMFYRDKTVVLVGGGNAAAADALVLSRLARRVILVHRRARLRATGMYMEALRQAGNVEFRWESVVEELMSDKVLRAVRIRNVQRDTVETIDCDGVFVSIGREPATGLVQGQLALDPAGYICADETTRTDVPGVFAAGDVRSKPLRQIVTAVADGATAAHFAETYLAGD